MTGVRRDPEARTSFGTREGALLDGADPRGLPTRGGTGVPVVDGDRENPRPPSRVGVPLGRTGQWFRLPPWAMGGGGVGVDLRARWVGRSGRES